MSGRNETVSGALTSALSTEAQMAGSADCGSMSIRLSARIQATCAWVWGVR